MMMGPVQRAIRGNISQGEQLRTPDKQKSAPFEVSVIDAEGIVLLFGSEKTATRIPWECLERIPGMLKGRGWVEIGTRYDSKSNSITLDGFLKNWINRGTAGWVAVVLEEAYVLEIDRTRPMSVKIK